MRPIRVVLVDDHPLFLQGLEVALAAEGLEIVGVVGSGAELLEIVGEVETDAVLLDLEMPGLDGVSCVRRLRELHPEIKVVMLSGHDDPISVTECLRAGALCFVGKQTSSADIAHALRAVVAPAIHFQSVGMAVRSVATSERISEPEHSLTPREAEILTLVATGLSNGQVARKLWVTEQTVKFHLSNIYRKLDVANRTQAARRATELGLATDVPVTQESVT